MRIRREAFEELKLQPLFKGRVVSDSMEPVIKTGEEIIVRVGEENLSRFDIIVIYQNETLVCHYLWQQNKIIRPLLFQTRNMRKQHDHPVGQEDYLGKVISHQLSAWQKFKLLF
jgi:hypothetical protein